MSKIDNTYHQLLNNILEVGYKYPDPNRKGVERLEIPSYTFRHDFRFGFPAISTKKLHYKNVVTELLWFLKGDTNIKYLVDNGCNIWNKDAYNYYKKFRTSVGCKYYDYPKWLENVKLGTKISQYTFGDLGPVYGKQWRDFNGVDQIKDLIQGLKDKPLGTEHMVTAWNPGEKFKMALPACHYGFQIIVRPLTSFERIDIWDTIYLKDLPSENSMDNILLDVDGITKYGFELHWNQRSVDTFLGLPYNIASYATLALIIEKLTGYKALVIQGDLKKVHLYDNSIDAVKEQLSRDPDKYDKCEIDYDVVSYLHLSDGNLDKFLEYTEPHHISLNNYESYPAINVEMKERDE